MIPSTIALEPPLRLARPEDAPVLAALVNMAGHGLALHVWSESDAVAAAPPEGRDAAAWDYGRSRVAARAKAGQIVGWDQGDGAVAALTGYAIGPDPEPIPTTMPALFKPLQELENLAPNTWYVNVLATLPAHRGRGIGRRLLAVAETIAQAEGLAALSVIVADDNPDARRLYERIGYRARAQRPMVPTDGSALRWATGGTTWTLLVKDLET